MSAEAELAFVTDVLEMLEDGYGDLKDAVFTWVDHQRRIRFDVNANDLFWWATADGEAITPENLPALKQAVQDVREAQGVGVEPKVGAAGELWYDWWHAGSLGAQLFAARMRKMRPQRPCYKSFPPAVQPLFDACGPLRNPKDEG